jgi:RND family efflux transporter MFP subunit
VREIAPEVEGTTRSSRTKLTLLDPPRAFRLGSVITATLHLPENEQAIRLPVSAVLADAGGPTVWIVDRTTSQVSARPVTVSSDLRNDDMVLIRKGIVEGERVVIAGVHSLKNGQNVRVDVETNQ